MEEDKKEQKFEDIKSDSGIVREFWEFICENKKFWLIPLITVLLLLGLLIFLEGQPRLLSYIRSFKYQN